MIATSPNGWPVSPNPADIDIVPLSVGTGAAQVQFSSGVRGGKVFQVLAYVANALHTRVQRASPTLGCGGYSFRANVNDPSVWSNHASGTAFDYNWAEHPNGEPAPENWTDVQIAEIHKILDEVGGAVRWGGDYVYTPDPMHFEINVTPAELEGMPLPKVGLIGPLGVADEFGIGAELTEMSVSYPTLAVYMPNGYAHWRFTATKTGRISIDALLSHYVDPDEGDEHGPDVSLYIYKEDFSGVSYTGSGSYYTVLHGDQFAPLDVDTDYRNQGRIILNAVAGETYLIQTTADTNYPWIRTVVRIGDYAQTPKWVQPSDQQRVWAKAGSTVSGASDPTTKDPFSGILASEAGWMGGAISLHRAFNGPAPATVPEAIACCWHWARHLFYDTFWYWSVDGGASWNGTDPYNYSIPGYGTCPNLSGIHDADSHYEGGTVGYYYSSTESSFGFYYQDIRFRTFGTSMTFDPTKIVLQEKRNGQGLASDSLATYLPSMLPTEILEWESSDCTLIDVDYAWDEPAGAQSGAVSPIVKWYAGDLDEVRASQAWGPTAGEGFTWYGDGSDVPEHWAGQQEHLGSTGGGAGSWRQLATKYWDGTIRKTRFTALPEALFSDDVPDFGVPLTNTSLYVESYRNGCYLALRTIVRPSRYRIIPDPGIPDLAWAGVNAITIQAVDDGRVLY